MDRDLIKILQVNKKLKTRDEIREFRAALNELAKQELDDSLLPELFLAFDDGARNVEMLEPLVNLVLKFDAKAYVDAMIRVTEELAQTSPKWLRILYIYVLRDDETVYLRQIFATLPESVQQTIRHILTVIAAYKDDDDPQVTKSTQEAVTSILSG